MLTREGIKLMIKHHDIEIQGLFEELPKETVTKRELKILRKKVANECNVSPFIIFNNLVLENIEQKNPTTRDEFLTINGLAEAKWGQFGEQEGNLLGIKSELTNTRNHRGCFNKYRFILFKKE